MNRGQQFLLDMFLSAKNAVSYIQEKSKTDLENDLQLLKFHFQAISNYPNLSYWGFCLVKFASRVEKFFVIFRSIAEPISQNIKILLRK